MQDLDDGTAIGTTDDEDGVFDEGEAREVLATMIKEHSKRRTFSAVNTAKKAKNLARGFGSAARAQPFGPRPRSGYPDKFAGGTYKVSIEALKKRTKCSKCGQVGHWHRECPNKSSSSVAASSTSNQHGVNFLEMGANEVHFLGFDEFKAIKEAVLNTDSGLSRKPSPTSASSGLPAKRDYVAVQSPSFHEVHYLTQPNQGLIEDAQCATVDTGCQRTAVGAKTLSRFLAEFPDDIHAVYRPECHSFKSINGVTSTKRIACVPTSLGQHGSILRPAIFESPETQDAPFLLSLPFLLHCQASLHLDPQEGMWMDLKRFNHRVPLLIGPTGALRVPLQAFSSQLKTTLRSALGRLEGDQDEILMTRSLSSCHSDRASSPYPCPEPPDCSDHVPGQQALPRGRFASGVARGGELARLLEAHGSPVSGGLCSRRPPGLDEQPDDSWTSQLYKNCPEMVKQLSVAELQHMSTLINQTLEVREIENMKLYQWEAASPWSRSPSPRANSTTTTRSFSVIDPPAPEKIDKRCYCGEPVVILITRREGRNFGRKFRRCPSWMLTEKRCAFFQWLEVQDTWQPTEPGWKDPGQQAPRTPLLTTEKGQTAPPSCSSQGTGPRSPMKPPPASSSMTGQATPSKEMCQHSSVTHAGSNKFVVVTKCRLCGETLEHRARKEAEQLPPKTPTLGRTGTTTPNRVGNQTPGGAPVTPGLGPMPSFPSTQAPAVDPEEYAAFLEFQKFQNMRRGQDGYPKK